MALYMFEQCQAWSACSCRVGIRPISTTSTRFLEYRNELLVGLAGNAFNAWSCTSIFAVATPLLCSDPAQEHREGSDAEVADEADEAMCSTPHTP